MCPETKVVKVEVENQLLAGSGSKVNSVSTDPTIGIGYGGSSSGSARTKDSGYDVWDDDWSK